MTGKPKAWYLHQSGGVYGIIDDTALDEDHDPAVVYVSRTDGQTRIMKREHFFDGRFKSLNAVKATPKARSIRTSVPASRHVSPSKTKERSGPDPGKYKQRTPRPEPPKFNPEHAFALAMDGLTYRHGGGKIKRR